MSKSNLKLSSRPIVYDMTSQECIWSAAGIVPYRLCDHAFDCTSCSFDHKMLRKNEAGDGESWREVARQSAKLEEQRCRHMLSGYVDVKYCANNYDCAHCEYDQMVEEELRNSPPCSAELDRVEGFALARGCYFASGHTWARVEYGGQVRVGLDDLAACLLGPANTWSLPQLGEALAQNEPLATMSRQGKTAPLFSPVQGIVVAVNPRLLHAPDLVNRSPFDDGWIAIVQPTRLVANLRKLIDPQQADEWLSDEADRLLGLVHRETPYQLAATGAVANRDIFGTAHGVSWEELVSAFLEPSSAVTPPPAAA